MNCKQHENIGKPWQPITLDPQFNEIWKIICLSQDEFMPRGSREGKRILANNFLYALGY